VVLLLHSTKKLYIKLFKIQETTGSESESVVKTDSPLFVIKPNFQL
jgi:hypothetical protein